MGTLLRQLAYLAAAGVACFYVFIMLKAPNGLPRVIENRQRLERMHDENEKLKQEIERKKARIQSLQESPGAKDKAVHEVTEKAKGNETIIYLPESSQD